MVHTTVVGNYPRIGDTYEEQVLRRAIGRFDKGEVAEQGVAEAERAVVQTVLREQSDASIDLVTDGQITWYDSQSHIARKLAGVEIDGLVRYFDTNTYYRQPVIHDDVAWKAPVLVDEWRFARDHVAKPVKAVLTGPATLASLALDKHYPKKRALALDLGEALAHEAEALVKAGARHLQVDEFILSRHPEELGTAMEALEPIARAKGSAELTLFVAFGDVAKIYDRLLEAPADVIGLDLVQGEKTWAKVVKKGSEKPLVLGLVDARNTKLEDPKSVAAKAMEAGEAVDLKASYLSPSNGLEFLPRAKAREKLKVLVQAAKIVEAKA